MSGNSAACQDHVWELRGVSFDLGIGALDEYECLHCPAATFRQPSSGLVADGSPRVLRDPLAPDPRLPGPADGLAQTSP